MNTVALVAVVVVSLLFGGALVLVAVAWVVNAWFGPPTPFDWEPTVTPPPPPRVRSDTPIYDQVAVERAVETAALERLWDE